MLAVNSTSSAAHTQPLSPKSFNNNLCHSGNLLPPASVVEVIKMVPYVCVCVCALVRVCLLALSRLNGL